jgi:hypothetical protein
MNFFKHIYILLFGIFFSTTSVFADTKINDDVSYVTEFATLNNNVASVSLVWALNSQTKEQNRILQAFLAAKLNGPIGNKSVGEVIDFRIINDINFSIDATPKHLILTMQSPKESFHTAVKHTNQILKNFEINDIWLKRKRHSFRNISSTQLRTPEILENELVDYVLFTGNNKILTKKNISSEILRRPNQIILNARDFDFDDISNILLEGLPTYDAILNNEINKPPYKLPTGVIHLEDKKSTETLIFIGTVQNFESLIHQAESNTLYKYMGYGAGSEMFRIVRQEKRASYDPRSHFSQIGEKLAFIGLSATVGSDRWDEIYSLMFDIHNNTRMGLNTSKGLKNSHNTVINELISNLRRKPNWLVKRYLELHPEQPPKASINLELIDASFDVSVSELNNKAINILSDPSRLISIIIGGKINPKIKKDSTSYCQLPKKKPLEFCLKKLSKVQDLR